MINGLRDGTFSETVTYPGSIQLSYSYTYQNGKPLDLSTEEPTIATLGSLSTGTLDDPWVLEEIYW